MRRHTDAVLAALAGFLLTGVVLAPPVLTAHAAKAARIAAYEESLGPNSTRFGSDRTGRLAGALRDSDYREDVRKQMVAAEPSSARKTR